MMKIDDSVESLVHFLVHSLSPESVVKAARDHYGIASDNSGCGVNYHDPNDPEFANQSAGTGETLLLLGLAARRSRSGYK